MVSLEYRNELVYSPVRITASDESGLKQCCENPCQRNGGQALEQGATGRLVTRGQRNSNFVQNGRGWAKTPTDKNKLIQPKRLVKYVVVGWRTGVIEGDTSVGIQGPLRKEGFEKCWGVIVWILCSAYICVCGQQKERQRWTGGGLFVILRN
jgi:hypothetical protein